MYIEDTNTHQTINIENEEVKAIDTDVTNTKHESSIITASTILMDNEPEPEDYIKSIEGINLK